MAENIRSWAKVDGHLYESGRSRVKKVDGSKSLKLDGPEVYRGTAH